MFAPFYNATLRKYVELFGFLFKNIEIERTNGTSTQRQIVPITFAPAEKYLARNQVDPNIERPVAIQLPRLSYNLIDMHRASDRQINVLQKLICYDNDGNPTGRFAPVPYDLTFELNLKGRHIEDMFKVTDQIVPYFAPYFAIKAVVVDGMSAQNVMFNLDKINMSDRYEGPIDETRELVWTFYFTVNANFFGPDLFSAEDPAKVIRWVRINTGVDANTFDTSSNTYPTFPGKTLLEILPTDEYSIVIDTLDPNS